MTDEELKVTPQSKENVFNRVRTLNSPGEYSFQSLNTQIHKVPPFRSGTMTIGEYPMNSASENRTML